MSDIVEELRAITDPDYGDAPEGSVYGSAMVRAADEIARLRAALREIANYRIEEGCPCSACEHSAIARAALEDKP